MQLAGLAKTRISADYAQKPPRTLILKEKKLAPCVPTGSSHVFSGECSRELCVTLIP